MKKIISLLLTLLLIVSLFALAGCGKKSENLKFGFGIHSYVEEIKNADGETDGAGNTVTTAAAVLLDSNGKIVKCAIDTADLSAAFTSKGKAVAAGDLLTKYELGDNYNMKKYGGAAKEWYEQADAFVSVVAGKNLQEVKALKNDDNKGNDEVTKAGCTIAISDFIIALEKAVNNAVDSNAKADDTLRIGFVSNQADKKDATEEANGSNEIDTSIAAVTVDKDSVITAAFVDTVQSIIEFDVNGVSKTQYGVSLITKKGAGEDYGMAKYGNDLNGDGVVKEWNEQADIFAAQLLGKKSSDIVSLVDSNGYAVESIQKAGCTINVNDMVKAAVKAATAK